MEASSGDNATTVTWLEVFGATSYDVSITSDSDVASVTGTGVVSTLTASLAQLKVGTAYVITVCAINSAGRACSETNFTTSQFVRFYLALYSTLWCITN